MTQPIGFLKRLLSNLGIAAFDRAAIIIVPAYDPASQSSPAMRHVVNWLLRLRMPRGMARHFLVGQRVSRAEVEGALRATEGLKRVKVFLGHGTRAALLGPPQGNADDIVSKGVSYSVIYNAEMVGPNPSALFAYSCNSGKQLGSAFCGPPGRSFLGFEDETFLLLADEEEAECMRVWKDILQKMAGGIVNDGTILPKHEEMLRKLYDRHLAFFQKGKGRRNREDALYMDLILNSQRESLCRYPRPDDRRDGDPDPHAGARHRGAD